jgi:general secretion pathway protein D
MRLPAVLVTVLSFSVLFGVGTARAQTAATSAPTSAAPESQVFVEAVLIELDASVLGALTVTDVVALTDPETRRATSGTVGPGSVPSGVAGPLGDAIVPDAVPVPGGRAVSELWFALRSQGDAELISTPSFLAGRDAWARVTLAPASREDLGLRLRVRPQYDDAREIRLEIEQEVLVGGAAPATVIPGAVRAVAVVREGHSVMVRGPVFERSVRITNRVPVLDDVPLLGELLRSERREVRRRMLVMIVTPHVINDVADLHAIFRERLRQRQEYLDRLYIRSAAASDRPPADYTRTRGLVAEIHRALAETPRVADHQGREPHM